MNNMKKVASFQPRNYQHTILLDENLVFDEEPVSNSEPRGKLQGMEGMIFAGLDC